MACHLIGTASKGEKAGWGLFVILSLAQATTEKVYYEISQYSPFASTVTTK